MRWYLVECNNGQKYLPENEVEIVFDDDARFYFVEPSQKWADAGCIAPAYLYKDDIVFMEDGDDFPVKDKSRAERRKQHVLHNKKTRKNYSQVYFGTENLCRSRKKLAINHSYNVSAHGRTEHRISKPEVDRVEMFHYLCDLNERSEVYAD